MPKTLEQRVDDLEGFYEDIPRLVNVRFNRVDREIADLKADMSTLKDEVAGLRSEVRELPRIIAEMLREDNGK